MVQRVLEEVSIGVNLAPSVKHLFFCAPEHSARNMRSGWKSALWAMTASKGKHVVTASLDNQYYGHTFIAEKELPTCFISPIILARKVRQVGAMCARQDIDKPQCPDFRASLTSTAAKIHRDPRYVLPTDVVNDNIGNERIARATTKRIRKAIAELQQRGFF